MTDLEYLLIALLIPIYGAICYIAGRGNLLRLVPLMLLSKIKELEKSINEKGGDENDR